MNEHTQKLGVRKWAGDDLVELQKEGLDALQALVEPYAPCIIQGCEVRRNGEENTYTVSPGFVALRGNLAKESEVDEERQGVKIVRFEGMGKATLPLYLGLGCETENRPYLNGVNKPVKYRYVAEKLLEQSPDCLTLTGDNAAPRLVDTLGITQKLDRVGGDASQTKVNFSEANAEELKSGNPLSKLFGAIKKWLDGIKGNLDGIKGNLDGITTKLNGIEAGANKYTHPASAAGAKTSGLYKIATDANGHITEATAVAKSDITALGIPAQNTVYTHPTYTARTGVPSANQTPSFGGTFSVSQPVSDSSGHITALTSRTVKIPNSVATTSASGLMSAADKTKLDGIASGANAYTHPSSAAGAKTSGLYKITTDTNGHVTGAAAVAKSDITALGIPAQDTTYGAATASAAGLMSASDKTKLNGIAAGAQVNPAYATAPSNSTLPFNTDGYYQTGASNSGSYKNSVGSSDTVARGDHQHSLFIANATTSKPGLMSKTDKTNLDLFAGTPKVIYACSFGVKDSNVSKGQEKAIPGVSVSLAYRNDNGQYVQVTTKQSLYTYIIPIITGQSAAPAFFDGNTGIGSFRIRLRHGTSDVMSIGGATLVLIGF